MTTTRTAAARHVPVLRARVVDLLVPACSGDRPVYVDATLGMAGHAEAMLRAVPALRLVGIDRDEQALSLAGQRLEPFADRVELVQAVYDEVGEILDRLGIATVDAVLFDLGVSSLQLDETDRGFAYSVDAPLDMRMDPSSGMTAADVLATYPETELSRILHEYGEERFAKRVAAAIVRERQTAPITRSGRLVQILSRAIPAATQRTGGHPAKRTFQALRIEVNGELDAWRRALPDAIDRLNVGGRVVVLSYHSLEDRIAKHVLAVGSHSSTPAGLPVELPDHAPYLRLLTRGAETASPDEVDENPRAASVRLRAAERIRAGGGPS
jgi:16S rRNA (cytosine1402-N4)-methyltransferase